MTGVNFHKSNNKHRAYIGNKHLGYFDDIEDAIKARKEAELTYKRKPSNNSKLKAFEVKKIRKSKQLPKVMAIDYGVHISTIYGIINNKYWNHI